MQAQQTSPLAIAALASPSRRRTLASLSLLACLVAVPTVGHANTPDPALQHAERGAELFRAGQYHAAALAFEDALKLDPSDARNLRYCGRAWQEVGFWSRARTLLERYLIVERDEALRASIMPHLLALRSATPAEIAAALAAATQRFPLARLEAAAAQAYEALGDEASLRKAAEFWELARAAAPSDEERTQCSTSARRVQLQLLKLEQRRSAAASESAKTATTVTAAPAPAPPLVPAPSSAGKVVAASGGAVVLISAVLGLVGASRGQAANDDAALGRFADYAAYRDAKASADTLHTVGVVGVGVGAALVVGGTLSTLLQRRDAAPGGAGVALRIAPALSGGFTGLGAAVDF